MGAVRPPSPASSRMEQPVGSFHFPPISNADWPNELLDLGSIHPVELTNACISGSTRTRASNNLQSKNSKSISNLTSKRSYPPTEFSGGSIISTKRTNLRFQKSRNQSGGYILSKLSKQKALLLSSEDKRIFKKIE
ncbi:hypothetical protein M9H77_12281 [Catharanthus roseus]|uniref:Uncharacterized protein n=1 Tax=Catharanthus roseus TaxID=4058 RepID=A0ACC0BGY7_CATRO|nr:hypothetical protein M9H77_12281 [Catharanthus roseus]